MIDAPPLLLSPDELRDLTRRDRPSAQARVLRALGVAFKPHPTDGILLVSRAAAEFALGGNVAPAPAALTDWDVDLEAIRNHGKKPAAH